MSFTRYQVHRIQHGMQNAYVHVLMALLPLLMNMLHGDADIRRELSELPEPFTFALAVLGSAKPKVVRVEDSHARADRSAVPDFTIQFKSTRYAYQVFSGGCTLRAGTAGHCYSTLGDLHNGVVLVYLFDLVLRKFFGWRPAYASV